MAFPAQPGMDSSRDLRDRFARSGQAHVFRFWDRLDEAARDRLVGQAARIDLERLARIRLEALSLARPRPRLLEPLPVQRLPERGGDAGERSRARECGEDLLAEGRVGVLLVAGGQGSRLGFRGPKGAFPIGPVSTRSLLELLVQKIRGVVRRYGRPLPGYVMTSSHTDAPIRELLEKYYGDSSESVSDMLTALEAEFDYRPDDMPAGGLGPVFDSDCCQRTIGTRLNKTIIRILHTLTLQPRCGDITKDTLKFTSKLTYSLLI